MTEYAGNITDEEMGFHRQPIEEINLPDRPIEDNADAMTVSFGEENATEVPEQTLTLAQVEELIHQMDVDLKTRMAALEIAQNMYRRGSAVAATLIASAREIETYLKEG